MRYERMVRMDNTDHKEESEMTAKERKCVIDVFDVLISMDLILRKERSKK